MPTRKIADVSDRCPSPRPCTHPEHDPPKLAVFGPGVYEHTCPGCGAVQVFMISEPPSLGVVVSPYVRHDSPETWARRTMAAGPALPSVLGASRVIRRAVQRHGLRAASRGPAR